MPIIFALMMVSIGAQIISGIYALINPFVNEMGNIQQYNVSYYGAIAGIERAELALKGHTAGFEGSGGWINKNTYGPNSDFSDVEKKYFGVLALSGNGYGSFWDIKNLNTDGIVPAQGKGDLDPDVSSGNNYYQLTFDKSIQIALYKDESGKDRYYTGYNSLKNIKPTGSLDVSIRVPQKLYDIYSNGVSNSALDKDTDLDGDDIGNDIIVNRSLFGYTGDTQFTIFPSVNINADNTIANNDTTIREDVINNYKNNKINVIFDKDSAGDSNPCVASNGSYHKENVDEFNQSPENAVSTGFDIALKGGNITRMNAKFSLINNLNYSDNQVYPYLEIKVENNTTASDKSLPDTYFHITGEGKVGQYDVRIKISKPVFETSTASDFTVLF